MTKIEWTGLTWNPTTGCDRVSPGCDFCYALSMAKRLKAMGSAKYQNDGDPRTSGPGFGITEHADTLTTPLSWAGNQVVFVNSMSDLFHDGVSDSFIASVWAIMARTPQHTYQILTKRHARLKALLNKKSFRDNLEPYAREWPLSNVWLGVSAENQTWADKRIPALLDTPAAIRFVSAEPLLGPVDLTHLTVRNGESMNCLAGTVTAVDGEIYAAANSTLNWVIVGGESGPRARRLDTEWVEAILAQTKPHPHVSVFVKQLGAVWALQSGTSKDASAMGSAKGGFMDAWPARLRVRDTPEAVR